jgi:hypothetical protein
MKISTKRALQACLCLVLAALAPACGKSEKRAVPTLTLFKVKPFVELPPMSDSAKTADVGSISFRAAPLLTDEESQDLFEANLQLAGLLPIRIEIVHNSGEPIDLKPVRFRMHDAAGAEWKYLPARKAIARILKANDVYTYNPHARKTFEKEFGEYEISLKEPLTHAERRRGGFIVFQSPKKEPVASPRGLVLAIEGLSQPATITLN